MVEISGTAKDELDWGRAISGMVGMVEFDWKMETGDAGAWWPGFHVMRGFVTEVVWLACGYSGVDNGCLIEYVSSRDSRIVVYFDDSEVIQDSLCHCSRSPVEYR